MVSLYLILFAPLSQGKQGEGKREWGGTSGRGVPILKSLGPDNGPLDSNPKALDSNPRALDSRAISLQQGYTCAPCSLIHYAALLLAIHDVTCTKALQCGAISFRERYVVCANRTHTTAGIPNTMTQTRNCSLLHEEQFNPFETNPTPE